MTFEIPEKNFNSIEAYIVRRIQTLEGLTKSLEEKLTRAEEERDAYKDDVRFLAGLFKLDTDTTGGAMFRASLVYKRFEPNEFEMLREIKGVEVKEAENGD